MELTSSNNKKASFPPFSVGKVKLRNIEQNEN